MTNPLQPPEITESDLKRHIDESNASREKKRISVRAEEIVAHAREIIIHRDVNVQEALDVAGKFALGGATVIKNAPSDKELELVRDSADFSLVKS